jgi:hypothetical protein
MHCITLCRLHDSARIAAAVALPCSAREGQLQFDYAVAYHVLDPTTGEPTAAGQALAVALEAAEAEGRGMSLPVLLASNSSPTVMDFSQGRGAGGLGGQGMGCKRCVLLASNSSPTVMDFTQGRGPGGGNWVQEMLWGFQLRCNSAMSACLWQVLLWCVNHVTWQHGSGTE